MLCTSGMWDSLGVWTADKTTPVADDARSQHSRKKEGCHQFNGIWRHPWEFIPEPEKVSIFGKSYAARQVVFGLSGRP